MFDFVDASAATDLAVVVAEADARRDLNRELRMPVSLLAGSVADAAQQLVARGVMAVPWGRPANTGSDDHRDGHGHDQNAPGGGSDSDSDSSGSGRRDGASDVPGETLDGHTAPATASDSGGEATAEVDLDDLMEAVETIGRTRRFLAAAESAMVARLEDAEASSKRRGERTTSWLGRAQGVPGRAAAVITQVAAKLDSTFDKFAAALARGEIDHAYCAALVRASNERTEEGLVGLQDELLARIPGRRFGSWRRELSAVCALLDADGPEPVVERDDKLFLSETLDGLVDLRGTFTGSTAEELRQLVEAHTDRLHRQARRDAKLTPDLPVPTRAVLRARALLDLLRRGSSGEGSGGPETHINLDVEATPVAADADTDVDGGTDPEPHESPRDSRPLPGDRDAIASGRDSEGPNPNHDRPASGESSRDWFRRILGQRGDVLAGAAKLADGNLWRLLCNPVIHTFVTDSAHEILQMGRSVRIATPAQRRALRVRDGGCVFPGCDAPIGWTQVHHVVHWWKGGRSDLGNMCLVCTEHHDVTHRRGWQMLRNINDGHPTGTFRWITPSGEVLWSQRHGEFVP